MLKKNNNIALSVLLIAVLTIVSGLGTYAAFSAEIKTNSNQIKAGKLKIDLDTANNSSKKVFVSMPNDGIYPGWSGTKTITVQNIGTLPFTYTMHYEKNSNLNSTKLFDGTTPIQVSINDGEFVNINEPRVVDLGEIGTGGSSQVKVTIKLPSEATDEYQGEEGAFKFIFEATQKYE